MTRTAPAALVLVLAAAACSSQPSTDRPYVPDRPEVERPDGVEPEGLADIRETLGAQRAETRERENALMLSPSQLSTTSTTPWWENLLWPFEQVRSLLK